MNTIAILGRSDFLTNNPDNTTSANGGGITDSFVFEDLPNNFELSPAGFEDLPSNREAPNGLMFPDIDIVLTAEPETYFGQPDDSDDWLM